MSLGSVRLMNAHTGIPLIRWRPARSFSTTWRHQAGREAIAIAQHRDARINGWLSTRLVMHCPAGRSRRPDGQLRLIHASRARSTCRRLRSMRLFYRHIHRLMTTAKRITKGAFWRWYLKRSLGRISCSPDVAGSNRGSLTLHDVALNHEHN
jgi:hypothetical protein